MFESDRDLVAAGADSELAFRILDLIVGFDSDGTVLRPGSTTTEQRDDRQIPQDPSIVGHFLIVSPGLRTENPMRSLYGVTAQS